MLKEVEPVETKSETPAPAAEPPAEESIPEFTIADSSQTSESSTPFEIPVEPAPIEEAPEFANPAAAEPAHQPSFVPPQDVPVFAEFQVPTQEPPPVFEKPAYQEPQHSSAESERFEIDIPEDEKKPDAPAETVLQELPALEEIDVSAFLIEPAPASEPVESQAAKPAAEELP